MEDGSGRSEGFIAGAVLSLSHQMRLRIPGKSLSAKLNSSTAPVPKNTSRLIEKHPFSSKLPTMKLPPVLIRENCSRHCSWEMHTTESAGGDSCGSAYPPHPPCRQIDRIRGSHIHVLTMAVDTMMSLVRKRAEWYALPSSS